MMKSFSLIILSLSLLLVGCGDDQPIADKANYFEYEFIGSSGVRQSALVNRNVDGSFDLFSAREAKFGSAPYALATLGGWSTTQPVVFHMHRNDGRTFLKEVSDLEKMSAVVLLEYEQTEIVPSPTSLKYVRTLQAGIDFAVVMDPTRVIVAPLKPLKSKHAYLFALTNAWQDTTGKTLQKDPWYKKRAETQGSWVQFQEQELASHMKSGSWPLISDFVFTQDTHDSLRSVYMAYERIIEENFNPKVIWPSASETSVFDLTVTAKPFMEQLEVDSKRLPEKFYGAITQAIEKHKGFTDFLKNAKTHVGTVKLPYFSAIPSVETPEAFLTHAWEPATPNIYALRNVAERLGSRAKADVDNYLSDHDVRTSALFSTQIEQRFDEMRKLIGTSLPSSVAQQDTVRHINQFNTLPALTQLADVPVRIFTMESDLNNVDEFIIFQHGINADKLFAYPVALRMFSEMAQTKSKPLKNLLSKQKSFALIAIDHPLHGERGMEDAQGQLRVATPITPQTYMNFKSLLTGRNNLDQSATETMGVRAAVWKINDKAPVHFIGHSLGAITGVNALAMTDARQGAPLNFTRAVLGMPGGGIVPVLMNSVQYSGFIKAQIVEQAHPGLINKLQAVCGGDIRRVSAACFTNDFLPSLTEVERNNVLSTLTGFQYAAQTVMDSADPINNAALIRKELPIYGIEIVGDAQKGNLPDQTIPNVVEDAPYAGTEALFRALGLQVTQESLKGKIRHFGAFTAGNHSSLLGELTDDEQAQAAFTEIQTQAVKFVLEGELTVNNADLMGDPVTRRP